jgi:hypothetical protein
MQNGRGLKWSSLASALHLYLKPAPVDPELEKISGGQSKDAKAGYSNPS